MSFDVPKIRTLIENKSRRETIEHSVEDLSLFNDALYDSTIEKYLRYCLTKEGFMSSGVYFLSLTAMMREVQELSPGYYVFKFDYIPIAKSIGGNLIVVHAWGDRRAKVYWVDHEGWDENEFNYYDYHSEVWTHVEGHTPENIEKTMYPLSNNFESFMVDILNINSLIS